MVKEKKKKPKKPNVLIMVFLLIFDVTQEMWYFHVRFESINMPRYFMHLLDEDDKLISVNIKYLEG